jgi:hypothetical protein
MVHVFHWQRLVQLAHLMPREAKNAADTCAPLPPPQIVTWFGLKESTSAAFSFLMLAAACATLKVILQ